MKCFIILPAIPQRCSSVYSEIWPVRDLYYRPLEYEAIGLTVRLLKQ